MMGSRTLIAVAASVGALAAPSAALAVNPPADPGTHGCVVADGNGTAAPTVYPNSGTSQIGGNSCTFIAESTWDPTGTQPRGGGYYAVAQSWSITACIPGKDANGNPICTADPAHSYSSAAGSAPVGSIGSIPAGEQITVTVQNGTVVAGTPNGDGTS